MQKLLKRWYVWLGLVLLLGLTGSVALICSGRGRITQANFDRIQKGLTLSEVEKILGEPDGQVFDGVVRHWDDGPDSIYVSFSANGQVDEKDMNLAKPWETVTWYAKKGAAKVGVNWD
jgi:hypothetical protein